MANSNKNSHLTLDERRIILDGIKEGKSKSQIAASIGKDKSTIGKEIKLHRVLSAKCSLPLECNNYKKCKYDRECKKDCPEFVLFRCARRDRTPGACNGCSIRSKCRFNKYSYSPEHAQNEYKSTLSDSRQGVNLTTIEAKDLANIVAPLLKQGLSPYRILSTHPEIKISEKTLYNYIENDVFYGLTDISVLDLRRQVSRKIPKKKASNYKKRKDNKYLNGRQYKDYQEYMEIHPDSYVTQMDTVYNDITNGPFIQTFKFICCGILFCIYHEDKTAQSMKEGIDLLKEILGQDIFRKYVNVLLTDRGTEFVYADAIETDEDGSKRCNVFYCDPMRSNQKGSLENKHIELRYILPKNTDFKELGLINQESMNIVSSHVNSAPVKYYDGKSPLEVAEFMYPDLYEKLTNFGVVKIEKDKVVLKPYLLKK